MEVKNYLLGQLESLAAQREHTVGQLHQIDGATRVCQDLIGKLERAEDETKKQTEPEANPDVSASKE